jgi:primosomal protein N' (replication factor Y)
LGVAVKAESHLPTFLPAHLLRDLIIAGPAPAPLARADSNYRYQIMLRTSQMSALSKHLAHLTETLELPDGVSLTVDIDPVNLS